MNVSPFVVVEAEAACPLWMDHWGTAPEADWSLMEREEGELDSSFDARLEAALERLAPEGDARPIIVLVASRRTTPAACASRCRLAASLARRLEEVGGGSLVLTRGHGRSDGIRDELALLAEELGEEFDEKTVDVAIRNPKPAAPPLAAVATAGAGYWIYGAPTKSRDGERVRSAPYSSVRPVVQHSAA